MIKQYLYSKYIVIKECVVFIHMNSDQVINTEKSTLTRSIRRFEFFFLNEFYLFVTRLS